MRVVLETEHLILRRFTEADVENLVVLDSDPAVMRYINGGRPTAREEIVSETLPRFLSYNEQADGFGFFAVVEKASGAFVGWFHLRPPRQGGKADEPELGYRLIRSAWGKGYATEGSRALVDLAFSELGASRVFATTMTVNVASRRVMEKAGMRFVRTFFGEWPDKIEGDEEGDVEFEISRAEWERARRS